MGTRTEMYIDTYQTRTFVGTRWKLADRVGPGLVFSSFTALKEIFSDVNAFVKNMES